MSGDRLEGDGIEYEILVNAAKEVTKNKVPGLTCEIGVRMGLGSAIIMSETQNKGLSRCHIGLDPYGSIPYEDDKHGIHDGGYNNKMKQNSAAVLFAAAKNFNWDFQFMFLEDTEYFERFSDGFPVYDDTDGSKNLQNNYALVHLDGPHTKEHVIIEFKFFMDRMTPGGILVFDDLDLYDHDSVEKEFIFENSFSLYEKGDRKASYVYRGEK